ncbi:hypothetical protein Plo01_26670 [Planobispora longispora]|uniref:Uncharacterized protein n=1 Tax=Planobispora longispora TaxID=28887 RepID=A0A8J3RJQ4_9ACTN|nr:hypothetical protein GCM10020093_082970 [Planobispora longispora]GIH76238.1 hypothetical protein Plo01_26670 [Planobispora longispora]
MPLTVVPDLPADDSHPTIDSAALIDQIVREGARRMPAAALPVEVGAYLAAFADGRDAGGRRLVVRNGSHALCEILTAAGVIEVHAPRVNDERADPVTGERQRSSDCARSWDGQGAELGAPSRARLHGRGTVPASDGQLSSTSVFWQATKRQRPSSLDMTYSGLPTLSTD